jgi:hypothetical protein
LKCPACYGTAVVLESRHKGLTKRRRHQCSDDECKLRFTTYELAIGPGAPGAVRDYLKYLRARKPRLAQSKPQG